MYTGPRPTAALAIAVASLATALAGLAYAQSGANQAEQVDRPGNAKPAVNADSASQPDQQQSSDEVMRQLLEQRGNQSAAPDSENAPSGRRPDSQPSQASPPPAGLGGDQSVLGIAPGQSQNQDQAELLREGSFIVNRRGHLARAEDSSRLLFVFAADKKDSPERPMMLQACRTLESMEQIVQKRGKSISFIVSGQVHTYRGRNYLMPTMMKIARERDNLK